MIDKYIAIGRRTNTTYRTAIYLYVYLIFEYRVVLMLESMIEVVTTFVAIISRRKASSDVFTAFIPSEIGLFVYKDFTSTNN